MELHERKKRSVQYFRQAYEAQAQGDFLSAIELYQKSIENFPTPEALTFLGWSLSYLGRLEEAIAFCKKAIQLDPDFGNPYNDIGVYLMELNKLDEAIPYLEKAAKAPRYESPHFAYFNLGRVFEKKGLIKKAMTTYQKALEIDPEYAIAKEALEKLQYTLN